MKNKHKLTNFAVYLFIVSSSLTSSSFANPVSNVEEPKFIEATPTMEQYQNAIQAFGVNKMEATVAAQVAVNTQSDSQEIDVDNLLTQLPSDFLEGSPY